MDRWKDRWMIGCINEWMVAVFPSQRTLPRFSSPFHLLAQITILWPIPLSPFSSHLSTRIPLYHLISPPPTSPSPIPLSSPFARIADDINFCFTSLLPRIFFKRWFFRMNILTHVIVFFFKTTHVISINRRWIAFETSINYASDRQSWRQLFDM